jgi:hypothetical protein
MKWLWYILAILGAIAGVLFFVLSGGKVDPPDLKKQFKRIDAETEANKLKAKLGHEEAIRRIEEKYKEKLDALDEHQKEAARRLRSDPAALSKYLVDVGTRL